MRQLLIAISLLCSLAAQGRITGTVVGHLRDPVPAAEVWVEHEGAVVARTHTDGSGLFVAAHLPMGPLKVFAKVRGHTIGFDSCRLRPTDPEDFAELRVHEACTVRGTVVDQHGEPVAGASVQVDNDVGFGWYIPEYRHDTRADERGAFVLERVLLGSGTLRAWAPGRQVVERRLYLRDDRSVDVALQPADGQSLTIRLVGATAEQLRRARAIVRYRRRYGGVGMPLGLGDVGFGEDGTVTVTGLPDDLGASISIREPSSVFEPSFARLDAPGAQMQREVRFTAAAAEGVAITGRLKDAEGAPLAGTELVLWPWGSEPSVEVRTDAAGSFDVRVPWRRDLTFFVAPRSNRLVVDQVGEDLHSAFMGRFRGVLGRDTDIEIVAVDALTVQTRVVDVDGKPVSGLPLTLSENGESFRGPRAVTDVDGLAVFEGIGRVRGGEFVIVHDGPRGTVRSATFRLAPGGVQRIDQLTMRPAASIRGVVQGPDGRPLPGGRVAIRWCDPADGSGTGAGFIDTVADRNGRFRFVGLHARGWRLFVYPIGEPEDDVPGPWFELEPGQQLETVLQAKAR